MKYEFTSEGLRRLLANILEVDAEKIGYEYGGEGICFDYMNLHYSVLLREFAKISD